MGIVARVVAHSCRMQVTTRSQLAFDHGPSTIYNSWYNLLYHDITGRSSLLTLPSLHVAWDEATPLEATLPWQPQLMVAAAAAAASIVGVVIIHGRARFFPARSDVADARIWKRRWSRCVRASVCVNRTKERPPRCCVVRTRARCMESSSEKCWAAEKRGKIPEGQACGVRVSGAHPCAQEAMPILRYSLLQGTAFSRWTAAAVCPLLCVLYIVQWCRELALCRWSWAAASRCTSSFFIPGTLDPIVSIVAF